MDRTNRRSTPSKTKTAVQHLYFLSNTYYERMEQEEIHLSAKYQPSPADH
jgi:hypothetical protein